MKKLTMLMVALLACVGVAKADFTQEWTKTTVWQTEEVTVPDGVTAVKGSLGVAMMETDVKVTATTIGVTFDWGKIGNCALQVLGVELVGEDGVLIQSHYGKQAAGGSSDGVYSLTDLTVETTGTLRYYVGYDGNNRLNDTGGNITVTGADLSGTVILTVRYTFGGKEVSSAVAVEKLPGENYEIPALDFTKVKSCKIDDADATEGATITVPAAAATVTVELENNLPFTVSTDYDNATWYAVKIRTNKYMSKTDAGVKVSTATPTTEDALWAFMGNPFDGITVLNKAAGSGWTLANDNGIKMKQGDAFVWNIYKGNGGFMLREGTEGYKYIHNINNGEGLAYWDNQGTTNDNGSAFVVTSEAEMISLAETAKSSLLSELDAYAEASYYTYSNEAVEQARVALNGIAAPTTLLAALQAKAAVETVWGSNQKINVAPAVGDIIMLKNRNVGKYLIDDGTKARIESANKEGKAIWKIVAGEKGVKLQNYETGRYLGSMAQSQATSTVEAEADAAEYVWSNPAEFYAAFNYEGSNQYGHESWSNLVGWWDKNAKASQWLVSNVRPLSITYLYNGETYSETTEYIEYGETYTLTSPLDFTAPGACKKGEEDLVSTDGVFSFKVTEAATLTVELVEDLPFKKTVLNADGSFPDNAAWYVVKQHSSEGYAQAWKYDETNGVTTESTTEYTDNHLWCFAGDKDNLKMYNKVAGSGVTLTNTDPASMVAENTAVWKMVKSEAEASFAGKNPFCLQNGDANSYLNRQGSALKYWGSKDQGSTIMVIAQHELSIKYMFKEQELTEPASVTDLVDEGVYTFANPYAGTNKYITLTCNANGRIIEEVDGKWSVPVTEATSVIVTITENLPFKTSADFATANWQYMQINSGSWKYVQNDGEAPYANTTNVGALGDEGQWAFIGDALNGFKILNKKAGDGYALSYDGTVTNGTAAYMKQEEKTWTIEKGNGGFIIRQGTGECLNDFNNELKIWKNDNSPNGAGSAFRTIGVSVKDLSELYNNKIYVLQAERSPLMYDAAAAVPGKLSSGLVSNVAADANDANQQFMIISSGTEGAYYLYSLGACKFVDADLNFTDYPEPVLSFEANAGNPVFPWFVKIGGKYVVPGGNGTDGNKIFHTQTPDNDDGKRYRIEEVDEDQYLANSVVLTIQHAEGIIKGASSLSNDKVYTVSTYDRGVWSAGENALTYANFANPDATTEHFAFLTVGGNVYLYSVSAKKFVIMSGADDKELTYTAYSDDPTQPVSLLQATGNKYFPLVVGLVDGTGVHHIGISHSYTPPVITFYNDLGDSGNKVDIRETEAAEGVVEELQTVVAKIDAYLAAQTLAPELQKLIAEAESIMGYLLAEDEAKLAAAKTAAEELLAGGSYTTDQLNEQITALTAAMDEAIFVNEVADFGNNYVYTFVSNRSATAYMMYDGTNNYVASQYKQTSLMVGADIVNCQWAVYKSEKGHYYMYNVGAKKFMGTETDANTSIPFSDTPQTTNMQLKVSTVATHPIMISTNGGSGVANHSNNAFEGKNVAGVINWDGGFDKTGDGGNVHKVTLVGALEESTLTTIKAAVELYETQGAAVQALDEAIAAAQTKIDAEGAGLGYYTSSKEDAAAELKTIVDFRAAIVAETTATDIEAKAAEAQAIADSYTVNLPQTGKFYRFSYTFSGEDAARYVQAVASGASKKANGMSMVAGEQGAASIFYYDGGADATNVDDDKLLSYSTGQYVRETGGTRGLQAVGATAGKAKFTAGSLVGKLYIFADDSFHANKAGDIYFVDHCGNGHPDNGVNDAHNFIVEEVTTLPVTVTAAQTNFNGEDKYVSTLFAPVALEIPEGITAYVGVHEGACLAMEPIVAAEGTDKAIVPANTGVILMADEAKTYDFAISAEAGKAIEDGANTIDGTVAKTIITPEENTTCYVLANGSNGVGLYKAKLNKNENTGFLNNACKVYIPIPVAESQAAQALTMRFGRGQGGTTDIESAEFGTQDADVIYDLTGRRIEKIVEKGIYIVNGKKVVVK